MNKNHHFNINDGDTIIEKVGNWVSPGYANDDNNYFWESQML